jgi:uncharacterized protein (DUF433 family)
MIDACPDRIVVDPLICGGRPCIRNTRMRVADLIEMMAAGAMRAEILEDFPYISDDDLSAALFFAADAVRREISPRDTG